MTTKILIVDDDPELLRLIGLALHRAGFEPITAQNAEDALRKVQKEEPKLIILDVMLPGVSGIELCRQLRSESKTLPLPIIMLSARAQVDDKIEGLEAGADDYLTKPVSPKEMVARVRSHLDRAERLRSAVAHRRGMVIGVLGAKGGVGTTTVAVNIAVAMAQRGQSVVAVEFRPHFGSFAMHLGHTPRETLYTLFSDSGAHLDEETVKSHLTPDASGIEALYGPGESNVWMPIEPQQAQDLLDTLARLFDMVIVDFDTNLSPASEAALSVCDRVLLITRPETDNLAAGRKVIALIKKWGAGRGVIDAVIVNHAPLALGIKIEDAEEQLGCRVASIIPPAADACALAHRRGRPLLISQPNNPAVRKLVQLAEGLLEREAV